MPFDFRKEYSSLSREDVTKLKKYFYDKKRQEGSGEQDILSLLLPSFIGILLCLICLTGMTWAWFTSAITTTSTISGASFNIEVEIKETDTSGAIEGTNGSYALEANKDYTVTIKKAASSTASGYGLITIGTACYYTDKIDTSEYKFQIETGATDDGHLHTGMGDTGFIGRGKNNQRRLCYVGKHYRPIRRYNA